MRKSLFTAAASLLIGSLAFGQTYFINEDFESGLPSGWTQSTLATDGGWLTGSPTALSSTSFAITTNDGDLIATNDDGCNCDKSADSLFTDMIDLSTASGTIRLQFDLFYAEGSYGGATESLDFFVWSETNQTWTQEFDGPAETSFFWKTSQIVDLSAYAGDEIMIAFVYNDGAGWTFGAGLDNVSVYEVPQYDLNNITIDNSPFQEVNSSTNITGTVQNMGTETITSFEVSYTVDGGSAVTGTISGVSIDPLDTYTYTHPTAWTPTSEQTSTVVTDIVSVNGNTDENSSNDMASLDILVHPTAVQRKPILEQFTSSTCPPCTPGNANVLAVMANYSGEYSKVNYQMSWPGNGDPYYTLEGLDRRTFYQVNSVPSMHTDGSAGLNSNNYTSGVFESAQDVPAFINLDVSGTIQKVIEYEMVDGELVQVSAEYELVANCDINPIVALSAGLVSHMSINEDLTYNNVETNGETEFHDVMKKMLPDAFGTSLSAIAAEDTFSYSESHTFPTTYRLPADANDPIDHSIEHSIEEWDDLRLVVWVQDPGTGEVWQSENAEIMMLDSTSNVEVDTVDGEVVYTVNGESYVMFGDKFSPLGVADIASEISMFPNPANGFINFTGVPNNTMITLYDAAGRMVKQDVVSGGSIDVSDVEAGVYNIIIENDRSRRVEKISIVH